MKMARTVPITILVYTAWQIFFAAMVSPLVLHILTAEQMGFTLETAASGVALGATVAIVLGLLSARTTIGLKTHMRGFRNIKTREAFEETWKIQMYGCYDGVIAETHWSGTVLPLLTLGFSTAGIPFPLNAIIAVFARWFLHTGVHAVLPKRASGESAAGTLDFVAIGLLFVDVINSLCFLATNSIIAPIIIHTFAGPFSHLLGNKKRIAEKLGISLD